MLLNKAVSAILIDFLTAQDLSNEYASQISRKYKQYRNGKENILNNFDAPASVLKEIELELQFTITSVDESMDDGLDVEETWGNCVNIADEVVESTILDKIRELISTIKGELPQFASYDSEQSGILLTTMAEENQNNQVTNLQKFLTCIEDNLDNDDFKDSLKQKITQKLFKTSKSNFLRGNTLNKETVQAIIIDKLGEGILRHSDFCEMFKLIQELKPGDVTTDEAIKKIQSLAKDIFQDASNFVDETYARRLIQKFSGFFPHAEIMASPDFLRELPPEIISSLKIKTKMESYQWTISESGESLQKVRD